MDRYIERIKDDFVIYYYKDQANLCLVFFK